MPDRKIGVAVMVNEGTVGGRIGHLLATYAYDILLGTDTSESYAKQLQDIATRYDQIKLQMADSVKSRAGRTSQLSRPLTEYVGRYSNDLFGNIDVTAEQNTLVVKNGYIRVVSTPFTQKDTIRVEMSPGQGEVIKFDLNAAGQAESLEYQAMKFTRIKG
jgi:hypothetical protein